MQPTDPNANIHLRNIKGGAFTCDHRGTLLGKLSEERLLERHSCRDMFEGILEETLFEKHFLGTLLERLSFTDTSWETQIQVLRDKS